MQRPEKQPSQDKTTLSRREFIKWGGLAAGLAYIAYRTRQMFLGESWQSREQISSSEAWKLSEFKDILCSYPHTPDTAVSVVTDSEGSVLFTSSGDSSIRVTGNLDKSWLKAETVLEPTREQTEKGEAGYAGISSVVVLPDGSWLGFIHAEYHDPEDTNLDGSTAGHAFAAQVEVCVSQDRGLTWSKPQVLTAGSTGDEVAWQTENRFASGAGQPSAVLVGDTVQLYFTDWNGYRTDEIYKATAPAAKAADPASWQVNTETAALRRPTEADSYAALPCVIYAETLGVYLATYETAVGFYLVESEDGENWGEPERIFDRKQHPGYSYPSVLELDGVLYLVCAADVGAGKQHKPVIAELRRSEAA